MKNVPKRMAVITNPDYQGALTFNEQKIKSGTTAYIKPVKPSNNKSTDVANVLRIEHDMIFLGHTPALEMDFREFFTDNRVSINTQLLSAVYSFLLSDCMTKKDDDNPSTETKEWIDINILTFARFIGIEKCNKRQKTILIEELKKFHCIMGVIEKVDGSRTYRDRYVLLLVHSIQESTNTIRVSSPYMTELINRMGYRREALNKNGKPIRRGNSILTIPNYTQLILPSLVSARCKRAAQIVVIVVTLIEQTGFHGVPHIKAKNIIDKCPELIEALNSCNSKSDQNKLLKRTFSAAWEYLKKHTVLDEKYLDLRIPKAVPTMGSLDTTFTFSHRGRKKGGKVP